MSIAFLIILVALGLIMPLFWIVGAVTSTGYLAASKSMEIMARHGKSADLTHAASLKGQLGITMADGGDVVKKEKETRYPLS
jgi:hypothetical protein